MSFLVKPVQLDFLNNKDRENVFLSDDPEDSFNFKYVSTSQIKHIIKDVRRRRMRKKEESSWASFVREHNEEEYYADPDISKIKRLMKDNTEEVDQELMRLKEDALPERTKRISTSLFVDGIKNNRAKGVEKSSIIEERTEESEAESNDTALPVEETKSASSPERSPVSKLEYRTRARKSRSERPLRSKSESGDGFRGSVKHSEHNCCSGESRGCGESDNENASYDIRPHPIVAHKILAIQRKISNLLDEIGFRLSRIPLPDGDRDLQRRQQCVMEFAIRFSRNYLYDLGRQVADIQRHLRSVSPSARLKPSRRAFSLHVQAIETKLTLAHQLLLQALNAYSKHIPSSVLKGQPGKLKEILQVVVDLTDICGKINLTADYFERGDVEPPPLGKDTQNRCSTILSKLRLSSDNESQVFNRTAQSTPIERFCNRTTDKKDNCKGLPPRLSMYNANIRLPSKNIGNAKHVASCTRERRLSNNVRRTPQRYHPTTPEQPNQKPLTYRTLKENPKRIKAKIRLPPKEDEISTMMSILPTDSDAGSSIGMFGNSQPSVSIHKGSITRRYTSRNPSPSNTGASNTPTNERCNVPDENYNELAKESNPITDKQLSNLVPVIADLMTLVRNQRQSDVSIRPVSSNSMEALTEFLRKYRSSTNSEVPTNELANKALTSTGGNYENSLRPARRTTGTRIGAKNMQLICLSSEEKKSQGRTNEVANSSTVSSRALCNQRIPMFRVSESSLTELLKYRDDYRDWSRSNPMYTSKSQNKPWDVVAWIADKLVDELVIDVSKEFEIYDVIQKLFELEFKEF